MTTKLPPLMVSSEEEGFFVLRPNLHNLTHDQAAHIIRLVEVVHPRMVALLGSFPGFTDDALVGDPWAEELRAILKEVQS